MDHTRIIINQIFSCKEQVLLTTETVMSFLIKRTTMINKQTVNIAFTGGCSLLAHIFHQNKSCRMHDSMWMKIATVYQGRQLGMLSDTDRFAWTINHNYPNSFHPSQWRQVAIPNFQLIQIQKKSTISLAECICLHLFLL